MSRSHSWVACRSGCFTPPTTLSGERPFVPAFWKNFVMRPAHMAAQVSEVMLVPFFTCQGPGAAVC